MKCYSIEPKTRKYVKGYGFLSIARNLCNKYRTYRTRCFKTTSEKLFHKADETANEFIGNNITTEVAKLYDGEIVKLDENSRNN